MTDDHPIVSVIIPAWNRPGGVAVSIHSVLDQSRDDLELIVVDDGSDDETPDTIEGIEDPRLRVVRTAHRGVSAARNTGAHEAHGSVLIYLDCEDVVDPGWVEELSNLILCGERDLTIAGWRLRDSDGRETVWIPNPARMTPDDLAPHFLAGSWAISRDLFLACGGFDEAIRYGECSELALKLLLPPNHPRIHLVDRPLHTHHRRVGLSLGTQADGARVVLQNYRSKRQYFPRLWADYHTLVGVNDAQNGRHLQAFPHFVAALTADPGGKRRASRLLISLFPPAAAVAWAGTSRHPSVRAATSDASPEVLTSPKEPPSVLLLERYGVRGGAQVVFCDLIEHIDNSRFRPLVVCLAPGSMADELADRGIKTYVTAIGKLRSFAQLRRAAQQLGQLAADCKREKVQLVHINQLGGRLPVVFGVVLARLIGVPTVWHVHDPPDDVTSRTSRIFTWMLGRLQPPWTIFANPSAMQAYLQYYRRRDSHSLILPGIVAPRADTTARRHLRSDLGIPDHIPVLAMVARLTDRKSQHTLLEAIARLTYDHVDVHAVLCGGLGPPEYHDHLKRLVDDLGIADRITFAGYVEDNIKDAIISSCDVYVHTADFEPLGLAVLEAMAAGRPVIAADAAGPTFIIDPGINGLLYPRGDAIALAAAIESIVRDPNEIERLGEAGRLRAAEFSVDKMVAAIEEVWDAVLNENGMPAVKRMDLTGIGQCP